MENWENRNLTLCWLRRKAYAFRDQRNALGWLRDIGVVPSDVLTRRTAKVRLDIDPNNIEAGYLASFAYEWDSLGASSPVDFVEAVEAETAGSSARVALARLWQMLRTREDGLVAA